MSNNLRLTPLADGRFSFDVAADQVGAHAVIAEVPASAVDKDTGMPVGTAFTLKTPPPARAAAGSVFVSPLTTQVVDVAATRNIHTASAESAVRGPAARHGARVPWATSSA